VRKTLWVSLPFQRGSWAKQFHCPSLGCSERPCILLELQECLRPKARNLNKEHNHMSNEQLKSRPVADVRLGNIKAAIWKSENEAGARHSATFERLYREGEVWKSSQSFGRDDLLVLAKVADLANSKIYELKSE
jgi:hypothetical protein